MIKELVNYVEEVTTDLRVGVGMFSDTYNEAVVLNWKGGIQPTNSIGKYESYQRRPFLQIIVRSESFDNADTQAYNIFKHMEKLHGEYGGEYIISCIQSGEVLNRGRDTKNRWEFLMNFTLRIQTKQEE